MEILKFARLHIVAAIVVLAILVVTIAAIWWLRMMYRLRDGKFLRPHENARLEEGYLTEELDPEKEPELPIVEPEGQISITLGPSDATEFLRPAMSTPPSRTYAVRPGYRFLDSVDFSITAPLTIVPGAVFELSFWAHLEEQRDEVLSRARKIMANSDMMSRSEGPFKLERGCSFTVRVTVPDFRIEPSQKTLLWDGDIASATFIGTAPSISGRGSYKGRASIRVNGLQIARMDFLLAVGPGASGVAVAPAFGLTFHKTAFASYASQDRDRVFACIQGMEAASKSLKVFVDVINLRSGELWETELWNVIPRSDVFYLFWCRHAKESPWVEKEWRCALKKRGADFIDPIPLEGPSIAPPPMELAMKHFNDPLLAFIGHPHKYDP